MPLSIEEIISSNSNYTAKVEPDEDLTFMMPNFISFTFNGDFSAIFPITNLWA